MSYSGCLQTPSDNNHKPNGSEKTLYVGYGSQQDFHTIQDAINASENGYTIYVQEGKYYETLYINKSINLTSEGKTKSSIIGGTAEISDSMTIIQIDADNCSIDGFIITRNGTAISNGITINSSNNKIINSTIIDITEGIVLQPQTQNNTIIGNNITNTNYGIKTEQSSNNIIANNTLKSNTLYGMFFNYNSDQNIFYHNVFSTNNYALRIKGSTRNKVYDNCFLNNSWGLYFCCGATDNTAYNNIFKLNNINIHEDTSLHNNFNVSLEGGNYYDNYTGVDANNDGFGDTPYYVHGSNETDLKPLMSPINFPFCNESN